MNHFVLSQLGVTAWTLRKNLPSKEFKLLLTNRGTNWLSIVEYTEKFLPDLLDKILKAAEAKPISNLFEIPWTPFTEIHFQPVAILILGERAAKIIPCTEYACPIITTYSLEHLQQHPEAKRKAWATIQHEKRKLHH